MKKILFLIDNLGGGGVEKAVTIIASQLQKEGLEVSLILLENHITFPVDSNINVIFLRKKIKQFNKVLLLLKLVKHIKKIQPDIIFAANSNSQILSILSIPFYKTPRIMMIQTDLQIKYKKRKLMFFLLLGLYKFATGFCTTAKGLETSLIKYFPNKPFSTIPNPIDLDEINTKKNNPIAAEFESIFQKKTLINIGRLTAAKDQANLLRAFAKLKKSINLVILGMGEKKAELEQLVKKLGIQKKVFFLGFQPNPYGFLKKSTLFVLSSQREGFGNVIIEAMACGCPILSTDCPSGPRDILDPMNNYSSLQNNSFHCGQYGILTPQNNDSQLSSAIEYLLDNQDTLDHYKGQSKKRSYDYKKELIAKSYISFINNLIE